MTPDEALGRLQELLEEANVCYSTTEEHPEHVKAQEAINALRGHMAKHQALVERVRPLAEQLEEFEWWEGGGDCEGCHQHQDDGHTPTCPVDPATLRELID